MTSKRSHVYRNDNRKSISTLKGSYVYEVDINGNINERRVSFNFSNFLNGKVMAGTFSQIYIQIVFAVKGRGNFIQPNWEEELYKYITGILTKKDQKMLAINGMPDHIHIFFGMRPVCCLSDLVREVKKSSNEFIKNKNFTKGHFAWQDGYGAFSYSHSALDSVIKYVMNQKEHHKKRTFRAEYEDLLNKFQIPFKKEHLFDWYD